MNLITLLRLPFQIEPPWNTVYPFFFLAWNYGVNDCYLSTAWKQFLPHCVTPWEFAYINCAKYKTYVFYGSTNKQFFLGLGRGLSLEYLRHSNENIYLGCYVYSVEVENNFLPQNIFSRVESFCWISSNLFFHWVSSLSL